MKPYIPIVFVVVAVVIVFAVSFFLTEGLESPRDQLNRQIGPQVEAAQRLLFAYEPSGERLLDLTTAATTQPIEFPDQQQLQDLQEPFESRWQEQQRELKRLRDQLTSLGDGQDGGTRRPALSYSQLEKNLTDNQQRIDKAVQTIEAAVRTSIEADGETLRGTSHPVATRLQAILYYHKADLLRRRAAMHVMSAATSQEAFKRLADRWRMLGIEIAALSQDLPEAGSAAEPATAPLHDAETAPSPAAGEPVSPLGRLLRLMLGKKRQAPSEPPEAVADSIPQPEPDSAKPTREKPSIGQIPTPAEQLAALDTQQAKVTSDIKETSGNVTDLEKQVAAMEEKLAAAQAAAGEAQRRMLELEEAGVDASDPRALDQFVEAYRQASEAYRQSSREANLLEHGAIANATINTDDDQAMMTAPLAPADPGLEMQPQLGLTTLRSTLEATRARLNALQEASHTIETQKQEIQNRQQNIAGHLEELRRAQAKLREEAIEHLRSATSKLLQADELEQEALSLLTGAGMAAARNALTAARQVIDEARSLQQPGAENERLDQITRAAFAVGHATAVGGDLEFLRARILATHALELQEHTLTLRIGSALGITEQAGLVPESFAGTEKKAEFASAAAAEKAAQQARQDAIEAAHSAMESYRDADNDLKRLWVLHANMAAVHHLLAKLQTGAAADQSLDLAINGYERAVKAANDLPEASRYRQLLEQLQASR